ncbi:beta strand repeat-containing protein [Bradyrhizobium sp. BR 1433]|uniref:beta strand repeat-containing protein n=1 Tax=Bradyrhizobium sp. BR 1433 TaxID=3447967 RepID=UPI003EE430AD
MANDLGGNAKTLFSIDNGINNVGGMNGYVAADLLTQDTTRVESTSADTSLNGAKIWITSDGKVGYDASTLSASFKAQLDALQTGQSLTNSFIYAIRLGNGTLSWATATVQFAGANDAAIISGTTSGTVVEAGGVANGTPGTPNATGTLTDTDVDNTPNAFQVAAAGSATDNHYGTFQMTAGGTWTYTLDNSNAAVQGLNVGGHLTDTFTVRTIDGTAQQITVTINGANDAPSMPSDGNNATNTVAEGAAAGTTVGITVHATDVDSPTVTYSLSDDAGGRFAIDASTGVVTVANASLLDFETATSHNITVKAADASGAFTTQTFSIAVTDVAPTQPVDGNNATNTVSEGAANGDLVGITATSSDVNGGTVTFSLSDDAGGRFAIDASTGVVTVANASLLDFETATSHNITVKAADASGAFTTQTFSIAVTDVAPTQPVDGNNATNTVSEGAANGDLVGITATSSDVNGGTVTFSLSDDAGGRFAIDASTGVVTVANASLLDFETATSHNITVKAADASGAFTTQTFSIAVTDVAPTQPVDGNNATNTVSEGAANGDLVGITATSSDVNGGTVTFSLSDDAGGRFAIDASTGVVTVANASLLDFETATSHNITVKAADASGAFTTQTFSIAVTDVAPTQPVDGNNATNTVSEGAANGDLVGITATSSDVNGGTVTFSLSDDAGGRFAIDASTGVVTVANASLLDFETATSHNITVKAADASGAFTTQTFSIAVTDVAPTQPVDGNNATNTVSEGAANGDLVGITATSSDVNGGTVTFSLSDDAGGRFAIDASTGVVTVANASLLDFETATSHNITVKAADASGAFTTQTFSIAVTDVAPTQPVDGNNATNTVSEGAANGDLVGITATSSDVNGGTVTFSLSDDAGGRFAIDASTGVVTVANASLLDFETATSHNITVKAADASGAFTTQTFSIAVTDVAPTQPVDGNNATNTVSEGAANGDLVGITATSSDVNGGTVTFSLSDDAGGRFAIDASTGVVTVANASLLDFETATSHNITVKAADASGAFTTQTFSIAVTDVAPTQPVDGNNATNTVSEGAANGDLVGITATSSDVNGGTVTFSLSDDAGGRFAIDASTGVVTVANASLLDFETATSHNITVKAADASGAFTTQTFSIAVTDVAPTQPVDGNNATNTVSEGAANGDLVGITATSSDVNGGTVTFSLSDDAGGRFAIDASTGVVTVANASLLDFETATSHNITVKAADASGAFTTQTFSIAVTDVAPTQPVDGNNATNTVSEGAANGDLVGITATSSDVNGGTVTFSLSDDAGGRFAIDASTGVVTVANASLLDFETATSHNITVKAADASGAFTTQTFSIAVTDVAPTQPVDGNNATNTVSEGAANGDLVGITATSSDVNGGTVTFSLSDDAGGRFAIDASTGVVTVANASLLDFETATSHNITVKAADASGAFTTQTFSIAVTDVAPTQPVDGNDATNTVSEGAANGDLVGITATSSDVNGGTVTFSLSDDAGGRFAIDASTGVVTVANASLLDFETATSHNITVKAADASGAFTTQTFSIAVTDVAPTQPVDGNNATNTVSEGAANGDLVGITATSSDVNGGTVTFSLSDDAGGRFAIDASTGVVTVANASLLDFETATSHNITVKAADASGAFTTQTFSIAVTDVAPTQPVDGNDATNTVSEGAANGDLVGITATSSDVNGGTVTFSLSDDAGGRFAIDASTGVVTVANASLLDFETATSHNITVKAADASGAFTTQTFSIAVTDVAPTQPVDGNNATNTVSEGAANGDLVGITATSSDVNGGTVTFSLSDDAGGRFAIDASTGVVTVANASLLDFETATSHNITVKAADASGAFTTQTFSIAVTDVAPTQPVDGNNATNTVSEGAANGDLVGITATSSDVNGGTVTFSLSDDAGGRFAIDASTGVVTVANASLLDFETATSHNITVKAADASGAFTTQTFSIAVTDVAPTQPVDGNNATNTVSEGAANGDLVGITATSSDVNGGTVTFSLSDDAGGRFAIDASTGVVTVANASLLDFETATSHNITVKAADASGAFTTQTFSIAVTDVAPTQPVDGNDATNTVSEGAANGDLVGITATSSDVNGGTVTFSLSDDAGGRFAIDASTGVVTVANASLLDFETATSHNITVKAADASGAFTTQTFSIAVTDVAPTQPVDGNNATNTVSEGAANGDLVGITATSSDVNGGTVTFSLSDDAGGRFAIDASTGVVTVANASLLDFETATSHNITVKAADASGAFTTQTFSIAVTDVAPTQPVDGNDATNTVSEGAANGDLVGITATSSDVNGGTVTFSLSDDAGGRFAIDASTGVVTVANASLLDFETATSHNITVKAADASGAFTTQTFSIAVTDVAPTQPVDGNNATNTVSEGAANGDLVGITATSSDVNGGTVTFSLSDDAGGRFAIDASTGVVTVANASLLDFETATSHNITVKAADASGAFTTQTFSIAVTDVAPTQPVDGNNATNTVSEGAANGDLVGITATSSDVNGGTVTFSLSDDAGGRFAIDASTGVVTVANASLLDFETATSHNITVKAADASGAFTTQTFSIAVTDVAPTQPVDGDNATNTVSEGAANGDLVGITATSSDVNGGTVTFSLSDDAGGRFAIDASTGVVTVANASLLDFETATSHNITVKAADASGAFTTQTFSIAVTDVAPTGVDDTSASATAATEKGGTSNGSGGINGSGNVLTNDSDVHGGSLTVSAIRVGGVEEVGTAGTLGADLLGAHGTLTMNVDGSYTYVVNQNDSTVQALNVGQTTTDTFNYTVTDGNLTDTAVLTVTINGANDAPVNTVPGVQEVVQNTNVTFNGAKLVSISDVDVGAGTETVTLSVAHGTLTLSGTTGLSFTTGDGTTDTTMTFSGSVTNINNALNGLLYNPADTFVGADTLTITTTDQGGLSDSDTVTINEDSPNPGTLTASPTDVIFYASGTNTLNGTNTTLNGTDHITGGTGTDTLIVTGGSPGPFTFGDGNIFLTNFEVFKIVDTNSGNHTDNVTFLSSFQNNGTLTIDASGIVGNGKLNLDASAVTSGAFIVVGGDSNDILKTGSGDDTITGGSGADSITGGAGADTMTGGGGADTFVINSGQSLGIVGGSGDAGTISGYDVITDFATTGTNDILDLPVTTTGSSATTNNSTLTIGGATVKSHSITNGIITFDDANTFASALTLSSTSNVAAVVQYLHNNDIATGTGAAVAFVANIGGTAHSYVFEQVGATPNVNADILVDLVGVTLTNISQAHLAPAGIAGQPISLGLTNPVDHVGTVNVSISGIPLGWTLSEGTDNGDGTWSIQTGDVTGLSINTLDSYTGAISLHISQTWFDSAGGTGLSMIADNIEAFAPVPRSSHGQATTR